MSVALLNFLCSLVTASSFCFRSLAVLFLFQQVKKTVLSPRQFRNRMQIKYSTMLVQRQLVKRTSVILSDENQNWLQRGKREDGAIHQTILIFLLMLHHFRLSTEGIFSPLNFNSSSTAREALLLLHVKYLAHFQPQQQTSIPVLSCLDTYFPMFGSMSHPGSVTKLNSGPQKQSHNQEF